jgi:quercetin dioxygenase-like cupin family protein
VLKGRLAVNIDGEDTVLDEGDALYFDSGAPHSYRRQGRSPCAVIVVVSS